MNNAINCPSGDAAFIPGEKIQVKVVDWEHYRAAIELLESYDNVPAPDWDMRRKRFLGRNY
jgi:hypothetical protein